MHVLYVHQNIPAQFGHIAQRLVERHGFRCTMASHRPPHWHSGVECIHYDGRKGVPVDCHPYSRDFERFARESHAVWEAVRRRSDLRPDLIVGHSGFGSTLFLGDLLSCPVINYCEWFYRPTGSDAEFFDRLDHGSRLALCRNAMLLADLDACSRAYSPTWWQRSRLPSEYQHKLDTIFDGIDDAFWRPLSDEERGPRSVGSQSLPEGKRIVSYVSRGFESMRGFDVFTQIAQRICERRDDVVFLCIGSDRVCYGADHTRIKEKSFREHVLRRSKLDPERFVFTGVVPRNELCRAFAWSDLHLYLTAPFVLSWSLMNALACGCTVLASDTQPLREVIDHGVNGLLAPFFDVDRFTELACSVLDDSRGFRATIGAEGRNTILDQYSLDHVIPRMIQLYERATAEGGQTSTSINGSPESTQEDAPPLGTSKERLHAARPMQGTACIALNSELVQTHDDWFGRAPRTILHLGAWRGEFTEALAARFPAAQIVATETWTKGRLTPDGLWNWRARVSGARASFERNVSAFRNRIVVVDGNLCAALEFLRTEGLQADFVWYSPQYDSAEIRHVLRLLTHRSPETPCFGEQWTWPVLQRLLGEVDEARGRRLSARGNLWRLSPAMASNEQPNRQAIDRTLLAANGSESR